MTDEVYSVEAVPKMLKAGADVLIEAQRAEAQAMGLNETGGFINSIKATDVKGDDTEKVSRTFPPLLPITESICTTAVSGCCYHRRYQTAEAGLLY